MKLTQLWPWPYRLPSYKLHRYCFPIIDAKTERAEDQNGRRFSLLAWELDAYSPTQFGRTVNRSSLLAA